MDRAAWWATVHGLAKRRTCLKQLSSVFSEGRLRCYEVLDSFLFSKFQLLPLFPHAACFQGVGGIFITQKLVT